MRGCNGRELKQFMRAFNNSRLPGLRSSEICRFARFLGGSVPSNSREKLRISLRVHYFFGWVRHFKIPKKLRGSPSSKIFWTSPSFEIPRNRGKSAFLEFSGPQKIAGHCRKIQILSSVHRGKNSEEFLDEPVLQNPETLRKNLHFENFWVP